MDPFIAYLLIKQIETDNKAFDRSQKNTDRKARQIKTNCFRCGQNPYWCQCLITNNIIGNN